MAAESFQLVADVAAVRLLERRDLVLGRLDDLRRRVQWPRDAAWLLRCKAWCSSPPARRRRGASLLDFHDSICGQMARRVRLGSSRAACLSKLRRAAAFQANPLLGRRRRRLEATAIHRHHRFTTAGGTDARAQGTKIVYIWRAKKGKGQPPKLAARQAWTMDAKLGAMLRHEVRPETYKKAIAHKRSRSYHGPSP